MSLTKFALERRTVTGTLIVVLIFAGIGAYFDAPRQMDPGFIIRTAMITTYFPGASPERVEQLITDPIEKVVQEIPELDWVNSVSRTGVSVIYVNIREEFKEMRPIWDDLRRKVDSVEPNLPEDINGPIVNDEFGDVYPIMFSMTGDGFSYMQLKDIADDLRDELLRVESVAKVDILGAQEERLFVEYDNAMLSRIGMTPDFLKDALQQRNIIQPGGEIDVENETIALEPSGNFSSVEELRRNVIRLPRSEELVYLEDIVDIYRGYVDPPEGLVRVEGRPGLVLAVSMADGGNLIQLGEQLQGFFEYIQEQYPHGIDFYQTYFQPSRVEQKVDDFVESVLQAVAIVLVVMLLTLGSAHRVGRRHIGARNDDHRHVDDESCRHSDRSDVAGGAHHLAWTAGRQRDRDLRVGHGAHGCGRRWGSGGVGRNQRAEGSAAHRFVDDLCGLPTDPTRRIGGRGIHGGAFLGRDDHASHLVGAGADDGPPALRAFSQAQRP